MLMSLLPDFQEARIARASRTNIHPDVTQSDIEEVHKGLDPLFVARFASTGLPKELLVEFVYAVDHLDELLKMPNFPVDRMITTPDVINFGIRNTAMIAEPDTAKAVAVNPAVIDYVQEFFDQAYPKTIHEVLSKLRIPGITVQLDNACFFLGITYNTRHPRFGLLTYRSMAGKRVSTCIPFLLNRLS